MYQIKGVPTSCDLQLLRGAAVAAAQRDASLLAPDQPPAAAARKSIRHSAAHHTFRHMSNCEPATSQNHRAGAASTLSLNLVAFIFIIENCVYLRLFVESLSERPRTHNGRTQRHRKDEDRMLIKDQCRIRTKPNILNQNIAKKMYGFRPNFTSIETEYHRMSIFCFTLFEI